MHSTALESDIVVKEPSSGRWMLTGAQVIAECIAAAGIRTVFAYPGTSEIPLCEAISRHSDLSLLNSRGDKEAAFMAAGGNLAGSAVCAAILHGARGLTNALGAIAEVRRDEVPVLYIVGMPSRASAKFLPPHGEPDLIHSASAFAKVAYDCSAAATAEDYVAVVTKAVKAISQLPYGPVLLGVPQDLLQEAFIQSELLSTDLSNDDETPPIEAVELIATAIRASKNPMILVDDYVLRSGFVAEAALAEFSDLIGAPVFQVGYRRGPMLFQQMRRERTRSFAGRYEPTCTQHFEMMHSADLLITIEDRNMYPRVIGPMPDCKKIAFTSNENATSKNGYLYDGDILMGGNVLGNLRRIMDALKEAKHLRLSRSYEIDAENVKSCPNAIAMVNAIADGFRNSATPMLIDDSQMFGGLIANNYQSLPLDVQVFGSHGGFVGSGLPVAVGLAVANRGNTVVCTLGDQGFTNSMQALAVAGEQEVPMLILVCNNGSSVSLRKQSQHEGLNFATDPFLANNEAMSYAAIARGFGISSSVFVWPREPEHIQTSIDSGTALTKKIVEAISAKKPHVLELIVPGDLSFWEGVWNVEGLEGLAAMAEESTDDVSTRAA